MLGKCSLILEDHSSTKFILSICLCRQQRRETKNQGTRHDDLNLWSQHLGGWRRKTVTRASPTWATQQAPGHPVLYGKTVSNKKSQEGRKEGKREGRKGEREKAIRTNTVFIWDFQIIETIKCSGYVLFPPLLWFYCCHQWTLSRVVHSLEFTAH